jgi:hypothetical protein
VAVFDLDGTLTGTADSWVVAPHALFGGADWVEPWGGLHLTRDRGELVQFVVDWVDPVVEAEGGLGQVEFMETEVLGPTGSVSSVIPGKLANAVRHKQAANVLTDGHYRVVYRDVAGSVVPGFDELRLILRSGAPGASVRVEIPVRDPAWDGEVLRTTSFESSDDAVPLVPAASVDDVDADHYWFDPQRPSLTLAPQMLGSGPSPLDGELVILNVRR